MNSLSRFVEHVQSIWGPLSSEVVAGCQQQLDELLKAPATEPWLADLRQRALAQQEMYRDSVNGFVLLAHTEPEGLYRPGDIHDTRCISGPAVLFRFTERDLKREDKEARKLTRYIEQEGDWVPASQCAPQWLES